MNQAEARRPAFPVRVAAVDVGSNALRFAAAEFSAPERWRELVRERAAVRLGSGAYATGRLDEGAMRDAVAALVGFRRSMDRLGVRCYRAVATSATRESENGADLVARVRAASGLRLEIVSTDEEARLGWLALRTRIPMDERPWVVVDLGGGSLEVSLMSGRGIEWSESRRLGAVRLLEAADAGGGGVAGIRALLDAELADLLPRPAAAPDRIAGVAALGGSAEALAAIARGPAGGNAADRLPRDRLVAAIDEMADLSPDERARRFDLRPDRADVILPAAVAYLRILEILDATGYVVPRVGVREGLLLDAVRRCTGAAG